MARRREPDDDSREFFAADHGDLVVSLAITELRAWRYEGNVFPTYDLERVIKQSREAESS